jgi:hypothetical protein
MDKMVGRSELKAAFYLQDYKPNYNMVYPKTRSIFLSRSGVFKGHALLEKKKEI